MRTPGFLLALGEAFDAFGDWLSRHPKTMGALLIWEIVVFLWLFGFLG